MQLARKPTKFTFMSTPEKPSVSYTAFLPLSIVLLTLLLISGLETVGLLRQRQQLKALSAQLAPGVQQAQVLSGTLANLSKELVLLSNHSGEAKKIVKEFSIQIRQ
jgi:hypothetical protein